jgi:head-tail adaptor
MNVGSLRHLVTLEVPGPAQPDGDGGFTLTWAPLTPATWRAAIEPAPALEGVVAGTVQAVATHVLRGRYHPGITMQTRITKGARTAGGALEPGSQEFQITGIQNVEQRNVETVLVCVEVVE